MLIKVDEFHFVVIVDFLVLVQLFVVNAVVAFVEFPQFFVHFHVQVELLLIVRVRHVQQLLQEVVQVVVDFRENFLPLTLRTHIH